MLHIDKTQDKVVGRGGTAFRRTLTRKKKKKLILTINSLSESFERSNKSI